jgi:hypothetical protein
MKTYIEGYYANVATPLKRGKVHLKVDGKVLCGQPKKNGTQFLWCRHTSLDKDPAYLECKKCKVALQKLKDTETIT